MKVLSGILRYVIDREYYVSGALNACNVTYAFY